VQPVATKAGTEEEKEIVFPNDQFHSRLLLLLGNRFDLSTALIGYRTCTTGTQYKIAYTSFLLSSIFVSLR
jgi:hypothetical protein